MERTRVFHATSLVLAVFAASMLLGPAQAEQKQKFDHYISTGDNHWLGQSLPIDSKESIEATFDFLKALGTRRVYWRGLEEAVFLADMVMRKENCRAYSFYDWIDRLYKEVDPDRLAVEAAHKRGMEIWGTGNIFDFRGAADTIGGSYPSTVESKLRIENPEWVPVDKYGVIGQNGPIVLEYAEARKAIIDLHVKLAKEAGYDGIDFLTYAENFGMNYQDQFGYNEPVVKEFKRRYGPDIRTEPFNRQNWYDLRGEYVSRFLRELKRKLDKNNIKLGMHISSDAPKLPRRWPWGQIFRTAGLITMDYPRWIQEQIVDELLVDASDDDVSLSIAELANGTNTHVTITTSSPPAHTEPGLAVCSMLAKDESYLDRCGIAEQPLSALKGPDELMQMKVLSQIIVGKTKAELKDIAPLAKNKNIIMRRLALNALGKIGDANAVPIIEKGLADTENGVRCIAGFALRNVHGPKSAEKILQALDKYTCHPLAEVAHSTLLAIKPIPRELLINSATTSNNPVVRKVATRTLAGMATKELVPVFEKALDDSCQCAGYYAAEGLGNIRKSTKAAEILIKATEHTNPVISDKAATMLGVIAARNEDELEPLRVKMIAALDKLFAKLGSDCKRKDAEWGYRPVGNALVAMGAEGQAVLEKFMNQTKDFKLAEQAWKVLHLRQKGRGFSVYTEEEYDQAFANRPEWVKKVHTQRQFKL
ncbi:MAG: hypothetical protein JXB29_03665 [Sedimentisphaerales bacterium]|nr:hypothetical protein [Sedimentisphaerales bacterium]